MNKIQFVVNTLAENYGFDAKEALDYVTNVQKEASPAYARAKKAVESTQTKIDELQAKIDSRKVRDISKANAKMDGLKEKIAAQQERIDGAGKPKPRAKKETPAQEPEETVAKRISKLSKSFSEKLGSLFQEMGAEMTDANRKGFVSYINDLTRDDYVVKTMGEHMTDFIMLWLRPTEVGSTVTLGLKEIIQLKHISAAYGPGIYWDFANKRFITGPEETDEDAEDVEFNGKTYAVGSLTRRVYIPNDDGDVFAGFVGIGPFKEMTV